MEKQLNNRNGKIATQQAKKKENSNTTKKEKIVKQQEKTKNQNKKEKNIKTRKNEKISKQQQKTTRGGTVMPRHPQILTNVADIQTPVNKTRSNYHVRTRNYKRT